ncbi:MULTISPECIES: hypothetical protein [Halomonadaceae]|uniref:hypothetical protein n=1 Tax=Halomonadaceae TaxID=28256 RepID=UPI00159B78D8|nr:MULTISPECIES: hypothetical protein [Halomonas]QJQ96083.1 hypothetical protein HIO72_12935 [Halomonas sp. PA5]
MMAANGYRRLVLVLLAVTALHGCGNEGNGGGAESVDERPSAEVAPDVQSEQSAAPDEQVGQRALSEEPIEEQSAAPASHVETMAEPVEIEVEAGLDSRRQMVIRGYSNLPEATQLRVVVERETSRVRWQSRVNVSDGTFEAGPFGPGSGLPDGNYLIEVHMPPANVQPMAVREVIGERGEHLSGPLVRETRHGLGNEVTYRTEHFLGERPRVR